MHYNKNLKEKLLKILKEKSVIHKGVTLASGRKSSYYIDAKMTSLSSSGVTLSAKLFYSQLNDVDAVGGPTLGADPFLGAILYECWMRKKPINAFIVRKEPKKHGTQKLIEGQLMSGVRTAVIEDVITTGSSVYQAIKTIEEAGAEVIKVLTLVDREEGGREFLEEKGYPVYPVFRKSELGLRE